MIIKVHKIHIWIYKNAIMITWKYEMILMENDIMENWNKIKYIDVYQ